MLELLSPAGNLQIYKSVVNAGADAVYFGGQLFGARAYAANFSNEEAAEAIKYGRLYGAKSYLTVNTLLKNIEIERKLYEYLKYYYEEGIDAIIVQDLGVLEFAKAYFPGLELHASTQMNITSAAGAKYVKNLGCSRVVTARELSLNEISTIHNSVDIEIEAFVHGALCVCYSGQCLLSSMIGGRSGNRGRCAQPCRLPYSLHDEAGNRLNFEGDYLLSPKDFCALSDISAMAKAGVCSFKIEGRMKQLSYAAGVVSIYRKYIDAFLEGRGSKVAAEDQKLIFDLGNRSGFTNHYLYEQNSAQMMALSKPGHESFVDFNAPEAPKIIVNGSFCANFNEPMQLRVGDIIVTSSDAPELATNKATDAATIEEKLRKTGNTPFEFDKLDIEIADNLFIPIGKINAMRREALDLLEAGLSKNPHMANAVEWDNLAALRDESAGNQVSENLDSNNKENDKETLITLRELVHFNKLCNHPLPTIISVDLDSIISYEQLSQNANGSIDERITGLSQIAHLSGKKFFVTLPLVCREKALKILKKNQVLFDTAIVDGLIVRSLDELGFLEQINYPKSRLVLDYKIYTYSNVAINLFKNQDYCAFSAPLELNYKELKHLDLSRSFMCVFGRSLLMTTAACQHKNAMGCNGERQTLYLKDRKNLSFPVKNTCSFCYNEIYNSKATNLLGELNNLNSLNSLGFRFDFVDESWDEINKVLNLYTDAFSTASFGNPDKFQEKYTKGHFNRGVE